MRNVIILYKDNSVKFVSEDKINPKKLSKNNIKIILIPLEENPNAYIPIKPSILYNFYKAKVEIIYNTYFYDYSEAELDANSYDVFKYQQEFYNLIDFINGIYNVYKFRAIPIYISDTASVELTYSPVISIRKIKVNFYDKLNKELSIIESEIMKDLREYPSSKFYEIPPIYMNEDRMESLKDILFTPKIEDNKSTPNIAKLPIVIKPIGNRWIDVKKPSKILKKNDIILYKIPDFEVYYAMTYDMYLDLSMRHNRKLCICPITYSDYDEDLHKLNKYQIIDRFLEDEVNDLFCLMPYMNNLDVFLQTLIFLKPILYYTKYFTGYYYSFESNSYTEISFIIFGDRSYPTSNRLFIRDLLLENELTYNNITKTFLKLIDV